MEEIKMIWRFVMIDTEPAESWTLDVLVLI